MSITMWHTSHSKAMPLMFLFDTQGALLAAWAINFKSLGATIERGSVLSVYVCSICLNTHIGMFSQYPGMLDFHGPCMCIMHGVLRALSICCAFALDLASQSEAFTWLSLQKPLFVVSCSAEGCCRSWCTHTNLNICAFVLQMSEFCSLCTTL